MMRRFIVALVVLFACFSLAYAGTKITEMTAIGSLELTDILEVVDDPGGSPLSRKATFQQVADVVSTDTDIADAISKKHAQHSDKIYIRGEIADISTPGSSWTLSPVAGTVSKIYTVIGGAIADSDAGLSFEIDGTAITDGGVSVGYDGSAAGDVDSSTPSAQNAVTAGKAIELITDGASTNAVRAVIVIEITPS